MRRTEVAARRAAGGSRRRSSVAPLLAALLLPGAFLAAPHTRAAEPVSEQGRRHLAERLGGSPNDFELVYERGAAVVPGSGAPLWAAKYVDHRTGDVHVVYQDPSAGTLADERLRDDRGRQAMAGLAALERKADPELLAEVAQAATVSVGVWLEVDLATAERAVRDRHPELTWDGDRPLVADLETARAIRAELAQAHADARASALARLAADVAALGGTLGYASTNAPLAYVDLPADRADELAALTDVSSLGLERTWAPTMASAGPAAQTDWSGGADDQGSGVRVAVVEYHNVRPGGGLGGRVVASGSTSGSLAYTGGGTFDHPTWVAGAIAAVAPGALIVSASTGGGGVSLARDRDIIAAADWAASPAGGNADIINASIGQDTATGSEEARRYFDALVHEQGRLAVAAAGNLTTFGHWDVVSPGTAYNVLTVGGIDDRGTADRNDDTVWYAPGSNGSNYRDPAGTPWNPHGDFNKPNVAAPAVSVVTVNGLGASGTSGASPIVAGIAAQLIARMPSLALRPETTRALIMAGAINRSPMPDGSRNADHEGAGTASGVWANRLLPAGDGSYGGYLMGSMSAGQVVTQDISVTAGQRIKVALAWNSHTSGSGISDRSDRLLADLDLRLFLPGGMTPSSLSFDNNYEWLEFIAPMSGTARIEVRQTRFEAASERFGLAWAKVNVGTPMRVAGPDRFGTAAAVSQSHFAPGVPVAYVATGRNFPDALAAGPVAGMQGGPVLLTETNTLPAPTRDELSRLRPHRIVILGGPAVVADAVAAQLAPYAAGGVSRIFGADRFATAAALSASQFAPGVAAFVATGRTFPDALAAGPAAVRLGGPVLLTEPTAVPQALHNELARLRPHQIYVLGGPGAVSDAVVRELQAYSSSPIGRLWGPDRYGTAVAVSRTFFERPASVHLATGLNFPDALAAVPGAGIAGSPLLLVQAAGIPGSVQAELQRLGPARCYLVGGTGVITEAVPAQLSVLLGRP